MIDGAIIAQKERPSRSGKAGRFSVLAVLKKRRDFVAASRARRQAMPGFILQARKRRADEPAEALIRVGYTCSKKVGNAVARNHAKRRLREAARAVLPRSGRNGWDYVLIGRSEKTASLPFTSLCDDLASAITRIHGSQRK